MTPVRTLGNFRGSRIVSVMGMSCNNDLRIHTPNLCGRVLTKHIPSKEKIAVLGFESIREFSNVSVIVLRSNSGLPDKKRELTCIEKFYFGDASLCNNPNFAPDSVSQGSDNKGISEKCDAA